MELVKGVCFICSKTKVVSDSESVHNTIITLFSGNINDKKLLNLNAPKVCPLCYHSFVLMKRTHDDILHSSSAEKVHENCHLCGNSEDVIKVSKWSQFKEIAKGFPSTGKIISNVCSDCIYYLETKCSVKSKLMLEFPQLQDDSNQKFESEIINHSTPLKRTRTKAERKSPVDVVDLTEQLSPSLTKFKPLKTDRHFKKSKIINADPKFMNQILIIKLQSLNQSIEKASQILKKNVTPKKVRFQDIHDTEIGFNSTFRRQRNKENKEVIQDVDIYSTPPKRQKYKDDKDTEELVEYEIKTTPRRSRFREFSETESPYDPSKKSYFKIKLTKKNPLKPPIKPPIRPIKPVIKSPIKLSIKSIKPVKHVQKRHESTDKAKKSINLNNFKNRLIINVDRMKIPEMNGIDEIEIVDDIIEPEDSLDPLRIDISEDDSSDMAADSEIHQNKKKATDDKSNNRQEATKSSDDEGDTETETEVVTSQDNTKSEKEAPHTNGHADDESQDEKEVSEETSRQDEVEEVVENSKKTNEIISVSSEDDSKIVEESKSKKEKGEILKKSKKKNRISISEDEGQNEEEIENEKNENDNERNEEKEICSTEDSNITENIDNESQAEEEKDENETDENTTTENADKGENETEEDEELNKDGDELQLEANVESTENDPNPEDSTEHNDETTEDLSQDSQEEDSLKTKQNDSQEKDENLDNENDNREREDEKENREKNKEKLEEESEVREGANESREEENESRDEENGSREVENESREEDNESRGEANETRDEDQNQSKDEENKTTESNSDNEVELIIEDIDRASIDEALGSFETVSELDKDDDVNNTETSEDSQQSAKRKREDDSASDANSPDKKKKKVTFSVDVARD